MKAVVSLRTGEIHTYGNVMGIRTDAETCFLEVSYCIDAVVHAKTYKSGEWSDVQIKLQSLTVEDYTTPAKPY